MMVLENVMEPDSVQKVAESDIVAEKNTESNDGFGLLLRGFFTKKGVNGLCLFCMHSFVRTP